MGFAKFVFKACDFVFDGQQNRKSFTEFEGVTFKVEKDIPYADGKYCKLDTTVVDKKAEGKLPVLMLIHGGGFEAGDKNHRRGLARWFAEKGFFVVNVNYGVCPEFPFPEPVRQLVGALNWIENNAEKYNLDLEKMVVNGDSAGGYYAAMLACVCTDKELQTRLGVGTQAKFAAAVLNCGIYDIGMALAEKTLLNLGAMILKDFTGLTVESFKTSDYEWKDICAPIDFVTADFPRTFVTYADMDFFCKGQGPMLVEKLKTLGVPVEEYHSTTGKNNHCFSLGWKGAVPEENNRLVADYVTRFVKGELK